MKRSEMIDLMARYIPEETEYRKQFVADTILTKMEEAGMLAPPFSGNAKAWSVIFEWESEDE